MQVLWQELGNNNNKYIDHNLYNIYWRTHKRVARLRPASLQTLTREQYLNISTVFHPCRFTISKWNHQPNSWQCCVTLHPLATYFPIKEQGICMLTLSSVLFFITFSALSTRPTTTEDTKPLVSLRAGQASFHLTSPPPKRLIVFFLLAFLVRLRSCLHFNNTLPILTTN